MANQLTDYDWSKSCLACQSLTSIISSTSPTSTMSYVVPDWSHPSRKGARPIFLPPELVLEIAPHLCHYRKIPKSLHVRRPPMHKKRNPLSDSPWNRHEGAASSAVRALVATCRWLRSLLYPLAFGHLRVSTNFELRRIRGKFFGAEASGPPRDSKRFSSLPNHVMRSLSLRVLLCDQGNCQTEQSRWLTIT